MNEEMEFIEEINQDEIQAVTCDCHVEIAALQERAHMLTRDNAELISDNLELRAKVEALLEARAALPEFSVPTQIKTDKYSGVRDAFKIAAKRK